MNNHLKFIGAIVTLFIPVFGCYAEEVPYSKPYSNPGVIAERGGKWVGSDHLLNLSNRVDVLTEIVKPPSVKLAFTEKDIDERVKKEFNKFGIIPRADVQKEGAPLPLFHVLIMIYPVQDQYVAYIDGRLFEKISLKRAKPESPSVLQGITWENQNLIMSSKDKFTQEVYKGVDQTVNTFAERYKFFEGLKNR